MFFNGHWTELDRAVLPVEEILELFYSEAPEYKKEIKEAFDRVGECVKKCEWVVPMLEALKERGYKVYYLSNMSEHIINSNPDAFAFVEHMDCGIFSCDVKAIKPDEDIYHKLINKYGLVPEECVFIDDHKENTDVAESIGMKSIVFENREQAAAELKQLLQA